MKKCPKCYRPFEDGDMIITVREKPDYGKYIEVHCPMCNSILGDPWHEFKPEEAS